MCKRLRNKKKKNHFNNVYIKDTKKAAIICAIDMAADTIKYEKITENMFKNENIKYPEDIIVPTKQTAIIAGILALVLTAFSIYLLV